MLKITKESPPTTVTNPNAKVATLLLLDRDLDYVSPMATQLTYEGLVDELYNIYCSMLQ